MTSVRWAVGGVEDDSTSSDVQLLDRNGQRNVIARMAARDVLEIGGTGGQPHEASAVKPSCRLALARPCPSGRIHEATPPRRPPQTTRSRQCQRYTPAALLRCFALLCFAPYPALLCHKVLAAYHPSCGHFAARPQGELAPFIAGDWKATNYPHSGAAL